MSWTSQTQSALAGTGVVQATLLPSHNRTGSLLIGLTYTVTPGMGQRHWCLGKYSMVQRCSGTCNTLLSLKCVRCPMSVYLHLAMQSA